MKNISLAVFVSLLAASGASLAQTHSPSTEIRESTDPAKAADVERRAAEIQANQQSGAGASSGASGEESTHKAKRAHGKQHKSKARHGKSDSSSGDAGASSDSTSGSGSK